MRTPAKILNSFFVTLGVIFLILIIISAYILMADPFDLKPIIKALRLPAGDNLQITNSAQTNGPTDKNPLLTTEQEKTLESLGVNPAALPTQITPELESCFTDKLGAARVEEIKKGSQPGAADFFKASSCLK